MAINMSWPKSNTSLGAGISCIKIILDISSCRKAKHQKNIFCSIKYKKKREKEIGSFKASQGLEILKILEVAGSTLK